MERLVRAMVEAVTEAGALTAGECRRSF